MPSEEATSLPQSAGYSSISISRNDATSIAAQKEDDTMNKDLNTAGVAGAADIETIENLMADLTVGDAGSDTVIEALDETDEGIIEGVVAREEVYADQPDGKTIETVAAEEAPAVVTKTKRAPKTAKPKAVRDLNDLDASMFVLTAEAPADLEANKLAVIGLMPKQKKIAEKFENLFLSIAAGRKPSVYTMTCLSALVAGGTVTQTDLVGALKASAKKNGGAYHEGTARSQAGQMMTLFAAVGIASRDKQTLVYDTTSPIAAKLLAT
jgi:hypothetical protein